MLVLPAPVLANRRYVSSYARAVSNLLQIGGPTAFTQLSIRIPISDPTELIHQGPNPIPSPNFQPNGLPELDSNGDEKHKRVPSMSTRPTSIHQGSAAHQLPVAPAGMRVPSGASSVMSARSTVAPFASGDPSSTWEMWDCIRKICGYNPRLSVSEYRSSNSRGRRHADFCQALDLTNPLPPSIGALSRWTAEPVRNIWLPATSFIPNAKSYPVLSKACQAFLRGMAKVSAFSNPFNLLVSHLNPQRSKTQRSSSLILMDHDIHPADPMLTSNMSGI